MALVHSASSSFQTMKPSLPYATLGFRPYYGKGNENRAPRHRASGAAYSHQPGAEYTVPSWPAAITPDVYNAHQTAELHVEQQSTKSTNDPALAWVLALLNEPASLESAAPTHSPFIWHHSVSALPSSPYATLPQSGPRSLAAAQNTISSCVPTEWAAAFDALDALHYADVDAGSAYWAWRAEAWRARASQNQRPHPPARPARARSHQNLPPHHQPADTYSLSPATYGCEIDGDDWLGTSDVLTIPTAAEKSWAEAEAEYCGRVPASWLAVDEKDGDGGAGEGWPFERAPTEEMFSYESGSICSDVDSDGSASASDSEATARARIEVE